MKEFLTILLVSGGIGGVVTLNLFYCLTLGVPFVAEIILPKHNRAKISPKHRKRESKWFQKQAALLTHYFFS